MNKYTLPAVDSHGQHVDLEITVVDNEAELWQLEEPQEPTIIVTKKNGEWIVYDEDGCAPHPDFGYMEMRQIASGDDDIMCEEAIEYAKRWAKAVRGGWEMI